MKTTLLTSIIVLLLITACGSTQNKKNLPTVNKQINTNDKTYSMCADFHLTQTDVSTYFKSAIQVNNDEYHHSAILLPCSYYGKIKINKILYNWEIYAGGAGILYTDKEKKRFLCKDKCCVRLHALC